MNTAAKLTTFAATLGVLFAAGAAAGGALDPSAPGGGQPAHAQKAGDHGASPAGEHGATGKTHGAPAGSGVRGLAVAQDGVRLIVEDPDRAAGKRQQLAFTVVDGAGRPVRDFEVTDEKRMHLIVVRRDLTGFQHLHPTLGAGGRWTTPLQLDEPGSYRVLADFQRAGKPVTLAGELRAAGNADLQPLPASTASSSTDGGLTVSSTTARAAAAERETTLAFTATSARGPARLEPYLGAGGHLVALREGDLAFLHVHPTTDTAAGRGAGRVAFQTTFPTAGRYRLFLQVKVAGTVHTAAFTQEVK